MSEKQFYGRRLPEITKTDLPGKLIVIEGADGSGRSTQIALLTEWLEGQGYAITHMGLRRSSLVSTELEQAKQGNVLTRTTLSLFYATDFFDQLINEIVPALRAGFLVIADRYIYTLMIRDILRGADHDWVENLYSPAMVPDTVFYFHLSARQLVERNFQKNEALDYWESGMDLGLSKDMFDSFIKYQKMVQAEFRKMNETHGFEVINANRLINTVQQDLRRKIQHLLQR
jgi:dTMP kinase